jgi:hypothetical protein
VLETPNDDLRHFLRECGAEIAFFAEGCEGKASVQQD